ncbi:beta-N-acetylhexosaminidase [Ectothiorhodosinus mongolicus]|uniref:Beta-hexosaminidase n=1 Tax=Ectothiorhodosinus mongolicus TaxID=233100 RepID=A0A1R3VMD8_9GAMM|nr:beta-N-acetylhexosaminidase [Ectothiorhodosinus mongolicus]ULX57799.1 beta-N-acetylhexosaminidase [Ectothiorhodosinus mongolicus]SIT65664.1 beta-N-acetylhexosaminidase [Ectothiorhodosinus mongolicus]
MALGPIMLDVRGTALTEQDKHLLCHPMTGGVILFTHNFDSMQQITELVAEIHALRDPHLLVTVDHEGGRVQRFREGFTRLPAMACLGQRFEDDPQTARQEARELGWLMAAELRAVGIDFSFAPVLDLAHGLSGVIGNRALHARPEVVTTLAIAYMQGMRDAGMQAVGKHFPGHGGVREDSHLELPTDQRPAERLKEDIIPFARLIQEGLAGIMPAHVIYEKSDPLPAGFSPYWLKTVLRQQLGFQGVIFSDDLSMAATAAYGDYAERTIKALDAGCDMVLICNHPEGAEQALRGLKKPHDPVSMSRLARMHGRPARTWSRLKHEPRWKQAVQLAARLNDAEPELPV